MNRLLRNLAASLLLCVGPAVASAGIISFDFTNQGADSVQGGCGPFCFDLKTTGTLTASDIDSSSFPGLSTWAFSGLMRFWDLGYVALGIGDSTTGGGWSFIDASGNDSLSGTFSEVLSPAAPGHWTSNSVNYSVTGGTGFFTGATGAGQSAIDFDTFTSSFSERGAMRIAVPEPGTLALLALAAVAVLFTSRRRRLAHNRVSA